MTAKTLADREWLLKLLVPQALAEQTEPLTDGELALLDRFLDRADADEVVARITAAATR